MSLIFDGITAKAERICRLAASVGDAEDRATAPAPSRATGSDDESNTPSNSGDDLERSEIDLIESFDDAGLLELSQASAELIRAAETIAALAAGEIERRSRRELGYDGLAQRNGHRSAGDLLRSINKSSFGDANRLVRVGRSMIESGSAPPDTPDSDASRPTLSGPDSAPWLAPVSAALLRGKLSPAQADSISRGLGNPAPGVDATALAREAARLVAEYSAAHADQLFMLARHARDDLDAAGIAEREQRMHAARSLKFFRRPDGMWRFIGLFDPESAAPVVGYFDAMTSPRRGGPRFVGRAQKAEAEAIAGDPRTTEQLLLDTFVDAVLAASELSPSTMLGSRRASVKILVAAPQLGAAGRSLEGSETGNAPAAGGAPESGQPPGAARDPVLGQDSTNTPRPAPHRETTPGSAPAPHRETTPGSAPAPHRESATGSAPAPHCAPESSTEPAHGGSHAPASTPAPGNALKSRRASETGSARESSTEPAPENLPGIGSGPGRIEGMPDPVSIETVERHLCNTGWAAVAFDDDGQCVNVGRDQRLFTARQRVGLAARDSGCCWPECDRPPAWTEAHHINEWKAHQGKTDIADGILACRFHHLLLHNRHWRIIRSGGQYALVPPRTEPDQRVRVLNNKSPALRDLMKSRSQSSQVRAGGVNAEWE
ncbi:DUF222 domain-containing protein [Rathayibacter soli]|uniref:DUF222 domain-containing protein n=1 Tax=Rathayibacter soli TaxID=3144168 RepID=UPI0027E3B2F6|nr:DUF222 domain-containing protein [Glaciibacter superstes]